MILVLFAALAVLVWTNVSHAQLAAGDIAFVQYNADGTDDFAFVCLIDIPGSEEIKFTDNGWKSDDTWRTGEGILTWTAPAGGVTCGTVVTITTSPTATTGTISETLDLNFSGSGDQLIAYQGASTMIAAINNEGAAVWQADATSSTTSDIPTGLTNTTDCIALTEIDNTKYTGATTGTKAALLAAINTNANWAGSNTVNQTFSGTFTVTTCSSNDADSEASSPATQIAAGNISSLDDTDPEAINVFKFDVDDLGTTDGLATKVTNIRIKPHTTNTADWTDHIQGVKLNNGAAITIGAPTITDTYIDIPITSGNFDVADAASSTVTMSIYLNTSLIVDGAILSFMIDVDANGLTADAAGSTFAGTFSGADFNSNNFTITVVATKLLFAQQPTNTSINATMSPAVTVESTDINGNRDLDITANIRITSTGTLAGTPVDVASISGLATFSTLTHSPAGTGFTLTAERTATLDWDIASGTFDITDACGTEGFDGGTTAPGGWTFTTIGGTYTTAGNFGVSSPSLKFDATSDRVETADVINPAELSFWIKGLSTDATSAMLVEGLNGTWSTIENITASIPTTGTTYTYNAGTTPALATGFTKFRFTYTKSAGNVAFDDVAITCCPEPTSQATNLTFSNLSGCAMTTGWTVGNGAGRIVKMNTVNSFTDPVDGTDPTANSTYAGGEQVVYNGSSNTVTIDGLVEGTTYWFRVYEYNCNGTDIDFFTSTGTNNPLSSSSSSCSAPTSATSAITFTSVSNTSMHVGWTKGDGTYRIVVCKSGSAVTGAPTDNSTYSADATFNNGQSILNAGEFIVYSGTNNNVTILGLTASTTYHYTIFEFNCNSGCEKYLTTTPATGSQATTASAVGATLIPGNLAVLGLCSNTSACLGSSAGDDEISFVAFVDITESTTIEMTDNGWERVNASQWGNTEGVIQATRTGTTIPAGTVITFRFSGDAGGTYTAIQPDASWTIAEIHTNGSDLIMNSGGDQIFFMQGGTWDYGTAGNHDATIATPNILFGFNSNNIWSASNSSQHSNEYPNLECFSIMPDAGASDFLKYTGVMTTATQGVWLDRVNTTSNWTSYTNCTDYYNDIPKYELGYTIGVDDGDENGLWNGSRSTDWFNCGNWQSMIVPDETTNVVFPTGAVTNECTIGAPPSGFTEAESNDITIGVGRTLTINNATSQLDVYGNYLNNATLTHTNGTVTFRGTAAQSLGGSSASTFFKFTLNNSSATGVTLASPVTINAVFTLSDGNLFTDATNLLKLVDGATASSGSAITFVDGPMTKVGNDVFVFPVGDGTKWARIGISAPGNVTTEYTAQYFATGYGNYTIDGASGLNNVSQLEYWTLDQLNNFDVQVKLYWEDHNASGITDCDGAPDDLRIAHWSSGNSRWELDIDGVNLTGGCPSAGTAETNAVQPNYSPFTFSSKSATVNPLPINLVYFNARYNPDSRQADLDWATASESNNDFFTVERSADGVDFEEIGFTTGAGNSNSLMLYEDIDPFPLKGVSYYKLKQTDFDGQFEYSEIVAINILDIEAFRIWPNPADDMVELNLSEQVMYTLNTSFNSVIPSVSIIDRTGKLVMQQTIEILSNTVLINTSNLSEGLYLISLNVNGEVYTSKLVKRQG